MDYVYPDGRPTQKFHDCARCAHALFDDIEELHERFIKKFGENKEEHGLAVQIGEDSTTLEEEAQWIYTNDAFYFEYLFDVCGRYLEFLWHRFPNDYGLCEFIHDILELGVAIMRTE